MQLLVRAFPVLPGKEGQLQQFADELKTTRADALQDFHQQLGVSRETWHLQQTPHGPWVIAVTEISGKPIESAGNDYAASNFEFAMWFKDQVNQLSGIDPAAAPLGPPTTCIFDSCQ